MSFWVKGLLFVCLLKWGALFSQKEANVWFFGQQAGLDFTSSPPTVLSNGALGTYEGSSSISNANGTLLFYSDGVTVYNALHSPMANGTGLFGDQSTSQSCLIIKQPGNATIYYIFTEDDIAGPNGLSYSIVDMSLAAGLGSVTVKNSALYSPSCEKLAATRHCNGVDVWLVSHDWNSSNFRAYQISATGIGGPVISSVGPVLTNTGQAYQSIGQMKLSPNGRKLAMCISELGFAPFDVYDFDPATGLVSNPLSLGPLNTAYGCEFSPDGSKLYTAGITSNTIYQWDLCAGNNAAISASQYSIQASQGQFIGAFQLGPDGKIYIPRLLSQTLSVIQNPNLPGAACNYTDFGQSIAPNTCSLGTPNFVSSYLREEKEFTYTISCQTASFSANAIVTAASNTCAAINSPVTGLTWLFGDPASLSSNTSTLVNPTHQFSAAGQYLVKLLLNYNCSSDTISLPVQVTNTNPIISVSGNFTICEGEKRIYTANGAVSYSWTGPAIGTVNTPSVVLTPTATEIYTVTGTGNNGCVTTKTITITVNKCIGVSETDEPQRIDVFPNPFTSTFYVNIDQVYLLSVYDARGVLLRRIELQAGSNELRFSELVQGVYTLTFSNELRTLHKKLVKVTEEN